MTTDTRPAKETKTQAAKGTAIVTGASSGIGEEFARQLDQRGYDLVLVARRRDRLEALAKEIGGAEIIEADLSTPAGVAAVQDRIAKGNVEVLVNNAGFATNGQFADMPIERELEEIDLNVRALTQLSHAALGPMKARRSGTIINVASTGAYQPVPYMSTYAATKAYVLSFSEGIHEEAKTYGVTVTCLCPGPVKTEFQAVSGVRPESMRAGWQTPQQVVKLALNAAKSGSAIAVPGMVNKATANLGRIAPRFMVRKISGRMFKKD
jgi:short-subunit dehydrogenase